MTNTPLAITVRRTLDSKVNGVSRRNDVFSTYRPVGDTCPATCPFLSSCYASEGRVNLAQARSRYRQDSLVERFRDMPPGAIIRHHVSGDHYWKGILDILYIRELRYAHESRPDITGLNYTHGWRDTVPEALNVAGLVTNASVESEQDALEALEAGWPTVMVVPRGYPNLKVIGDRAVTITCPAMQNKGRIDCARCKLCGVRSRVSMRRDVIVTFPEHANVKQNRVVNSAVLKGK